MRKSDIENKDMPEYSETINKQFDDEILKFKENPIDACDHKTALKIAKERVDSLSY